MMTSRERLRATLDHRQPDRVCVDVGGFVCTGINASTLARLRRALLAQEGYRVRIIDPMQMLGEIDEQLRPAVLTDVVGVMGATNALGFRNADWKPWALPDGTPVLVPGAFNVTVDANGDVLVYPQGDTGVAPSARMPSGGFYFDPIVRQGPIDEANLDPADNCEEFTLVTDEEVAEFAEEAQRLSRETDYGLFLALPGTWGFGDAMIIPGPGLKRPRGIRDPEEWYYSLAARPGYIRAVFERQTEVILANIERLAGAVGDHGQVVLVCDGDLGGQQGPLISRQTYRELFSPCYRRINAAIHTRTNWKTFKHCCGSVYDLIPDLIEDGFDILNPVQTSAAKMDPRTLKREFGGRIVFWGGGVDTQKTLPFETPEAVYREVRERIDILNDGGGYVFAAIHNIQANVPLPNLLAMFQAIRDSWEGA
jgi:hypothetical protein